MKERLWAVVVAVVALVAIAAYLVWRHLEAQRPIEWYGTVEAHTMQVGSRVGGRVQSVDVSEGDNVYAGQVLLTIEPGDLNAQRLEAQGQLEQARAAFDKIANRRDNARQAEIDAAEARLRGEQFALERAKLDHERMDKLFAAGAATRADRDNADLSFRNATASVAALQAQLDQLLRGTPADIKVAQGQVDVARGRLAQIDTLLDELSVRAPLDARVEALDLRPGDILAVNATAARLLEPSQLYVRVYVPETELGYVRPGLHVSVYVDTFPKRAFPGVVEVVSDVGEFTPRNLQTADERADQVFATRVRVDDTGDLLRVGMAATVRVPR